MSSHGRRRPPRRNQQGASAAADAGRLAHRWGLAAVLAIVTIVAFSPALRAPFQFDDIDTIPGNPSIRKLWPLSIPLSPPADIATSGRPVSNLTLAINYAINEQLGVDPRVDSPDQNFTLGFHLFNLLLHLSSGALLFGIIRRTLRSESLAREWSGVADPVAWGVTALWLLHPIQTDAVNYVTQRTELLVSFFYVATLYCAIRGWDSADGRARKGWFAAAVAASLLGMGSKEVMIGAPLVVFLYDRAFRQKSWSDALRIRGERFWFYLPLFATALWVVWQAITGTRAETVGFTLGVSWYRYLYSQAWAIAHYLRLTLVPVGFVIDYGRDPVSLLRGIPGAAVTVALLAGTVYAWIRKPAIGFLGAWFFLILAPSSSFVPIRTEIAAERRFHLAAAAVFVALVVGAIVLARKLKRGDSSGSMWRGWLTPSNQRWAVLGVCALLAAVTFDRSRIYRDPEALWRDAVAKVPTNPRAHHNLALALLEQDPPRADEAEAALRKAIAADSTYLPAWPNLAAVVGLKGDSTEERRLLESVVKKSPHYAQAVQQLGFLLLSQGKLTEALPLLERLSVEAPSDEGFIALATTYKSLHRPVDAIVALRRALQLNPDRADAMSYLGATLAEAGDAAAAVPVLEEALARGRTDSFAFAALSLAYAQLGRRVDANEAAYVAVQRAGNDASALVTIGHALLLSGRARDAKKVLDEAVRIAPTDPEAFTRLGAADRALGDREGARRNLQRALAIDPTYALAITELRDLGRDK